MHGLANSRRYSLKKRGGKLELDNRSKCFFLNWNLGIDRPSNWVTANWFVGESSGFLSVPNCRCCTAAVALQTADVAVALGWSRRRCCGCWSVVVQTPRRASCLCINRQQASECRTFPPLVTPLPDISKGGGLFYSLLQLPLRYNRKQ